MSKYYDRKVQVTLIGIGAVLLLLLNAPKTLSATQACITTESEACCSTRPSAEECPNATLSTKWCGTGMTGSCVQNCNWHCVQT